MVADLSKHQRSGGQFHGDPNALSDVETLSINQISTGYQQACTVDGTFLTYQTPLIANDGTFTLSYTANIKVSGNVPFGDDVSASFGDPAKISGFGTAAQLTLNTSSTVPEPGSLSLLAACVFALGGTTVGRKRST